MLLCTINPTPWNIQMEMCAFCLLSINDLQSFDDEFKWKLYFSIEVEEFRDIVLLTALSIAFRVILNETNRVWDLYSANDVVITQFKGRGIEIKVSSAYTQHFLLWVHLKDLTEPWWKIEKADNISCNVFRPNRRKQALN